MKPLVSILIPAYNAEPWIEETINSALAQSWQNTEIIVVDDGSVDNTLAIAQKFESPTVKVIHQPNRGAGAARNRALQVAQGSFIQYLDADDLLSPDKIERQIQFVECDCEFVIAGEWARFYHTPAEAAFIPQPLWHDMSPVDWLVCAWEGNWMMHPAAWLVPQDLAAQAGFWDETLSLNDDGEYFFRVILASQGVKFCQGAKSFYRSGIGNSLSGAKSPAAFASAYQSLELCTNYLLERENTLRTRRVCAAAFQRFVYDAYPAVPKLRQKANLRVQQLGGCEEKVLGGPMFQLLSSVAGWKLAKVVQQLAYKYGYRQLAMRRTLV